MALVPITTVAQYTSGTADHPEDGDDFEAADVRAMFQVALDRAHFARGGLWGQLLWSGRFAVDPGGSSTVFAVKIGAISSLCVRDSSGTWRPYFVAAETTLDLGDVESSPANLSNSTWHYVYAYSDGTSTLRFLINTTAPAADLLWQSAGGDGLRRYLGCFRTNGSGAPIPVRAHRGRYLYRGSSITSGPVAATLTSIAAFADVDLTAFLPPHARVAHLRAAILNTDTTSDHSVALRLRTNGDTTSYIEAIAHPGGASSSAENAGRAHLTTEIETDGSQLIEAETAGTSASFSAQIFCQGFTE